MPKQISDSNLGQTTQYPNQYDPSLLFPIARVVTREDSRAANTPNWIGADLWTAFEISWLDSRGKPVVAIASFDFAVSNPYLIESKSFKLYLNSFNQSKFDAPEQVIERMTKDLSQAAGGKVTIQLLSPQAWQDAQIIEPLGDCVDDLAISIDCYDANPALLQLLDSETDAEGEQAEQARILYSNLLKSNCPVTNQPDWGTVIIAYQGQTIDPAAFLRYIVSYRQHNGFHELCVEEIYCDLMKYCAPEALFVMARYTRRGGLDINPWRASSQAIIKGMEQLLTPFNRLARQ
ncbi:NADPH-dependent 7-cyano-7-deazaguanine reductase QueF [Oligella urethralis]|uniref:NADPH-dependent 7-cyano-7-deazaguanine reductase n=1 Tax=Oligella urethralis TaxID=90245 RepID=A0A2N6QF07_9BURK|nr:NADPH-dependent 7-cyano-7-deazaguanine reductase QueF [Oligella urethralis]PMC18153.1 NADPH-dependent 7-cyano-7-deazaguanine reductase QueF [Oligella urethralis]SPY09187.1 NADPH-dependent 7-cyano-7-deazaguanine reductase [Oligella urethralis]